MVCLYAGLIIVGVNSVILGMYSTYKTVAVDTGKAGAKRKADDSGPAPKAKGKAKK